MRILVRTGNALAILTVCYFIYLTITTKPSILVDLELNWLNIQAICLSIGLYILAMTFGSLVWFILLQAVKENITLLAAIRITMQSQAAKYIPGNFAHHIGRVILAKKQGLSMANTLFTMMMETLWVIVIAGILTFAALLIASDEIFKDVPHIPQWWVLVILVCTMIIIPVLGQRAFNWTTRQWANRNGIEIKSVFMPPLKTFWLVGLLYIFNYLALGLVLQVIATQIFNTLDAGILLLSGIFAVAWMIGFITPGAPAGLGVREIVLVATLTPLYGNDAAIGITAMLRIVTVLGDGIAFLIGLSLERITKTVSAV